MKIKELLPPESVPFHINMHRISINPLQRKSVFLSTCFRHDNLHTPPSTPIPVHFRTTVDIFSPMWAI